MLIYPKINPVAFHAGPLAVHWYGLMYLIGIVVGWILLAWRIKKSPRGFTIDQLSDIVFYCAMGVILGGRIGYVLFYDFHEFLLNPLFLIQVWKGGMSFHGGLIGVIIALLLYSRKSHHAFGDIGDFIAPVVPIGLGMGRIGNFINGELWGRVTDVPWAMIFPTADSSPRHPSQLYEFFLEGVVMFLVLWFFSMKPKPRWAVSGLFLILYSVFRIFAEFFREPDFQIGYVAFGWMTKGQLLSIPMLIAGIIMMVYAYRKRTP